MKTIIENIAKLIDLKSLVTLSLTGALIYGFIIGLIEAKDFVMLITMVFTFYFAKKVDEIKK